jgi:hypothetical protein
MCLRNPDRVVTTLSCTEAFTVSEQHRSVLAEPRFTIRPDGSHLSRPAPPPRGVSGARLERAHDRIVAMNTDPVPIPLLFGDSDAPYLRLDQEYTAARPDDVMASEALTELAAAVDHGLSGYALAPGEICFVDNYRAVHGREAFAARHDGTDRWLRRLNITRDLRRSRSARISADSRLIL